MAAGKKTGGRKRGTPNKLTKSAKEAFALAFEGMGGSQALTAWAKKHPTEFYKLFARLIPIEQQHTGDLVVEIVRHAQNPPAE